MNITVESQPNCRATLHIEIPAGDVKQEREQLLNNYARHARLPGFRPGKAPKQVVARKFDAEINEELLDALVRKGYAEAGRREDLEILNVTDVKDKVMHKDESFTFTLEVSTVPRFELPDYKGIPVKLPRLDVSDADIDHDIEHLREDRRTFNDLDRPAEIGDFVVIDATGSIDGTPVVDALPDVPPIFKKIDGQWMELKADDSFLPGFYAGIVGMKKGDTRDVSVALPDDFEIEELKGKIIVFAVTTKEVKQGVLPEVNDEFASKFAEKWTLTDLRLAIQGAIKRRREQSRDEKLTQQVISHLSERLEFELPQDAVNNEAQRRTNDMAMRALKQGMDQDSIMAAQDQIVGAATQQARQNVKVSFILEEVAKRENLRVSESQLRNALATISARQNIPPKKLMADAKKSHLIENLRHDLLIDNAVRFLKEHAQVEETEPEAHDCGHQH